MALRLLAWGMSPSDQNLGTAMAPDFAYTVSTWLDRSNCRRS